MRISVVIPTYQRRALVEAAVRSLDRQTFDQPYEIIVAVDGSTDSTVERLRDLDLSTPLNVVEQPNRGAAAARNLGAAAAKGEIILFLDDDMEADPDMLAQHDAGHRAGADAVLGHMPLHAASANNALSQGVAQWTNERLQRLSAPDAKLGLHDMLTGQLSVSAAAFRKISGFDTAFTQDGAFGNEDVDLGHRLVEGGFDIRFNPLAISAQHYSVTPRQHLKQWRQAGRADVLFARKHPDEAMSLFRLNGLDSGIARRLARPLAKLPFWTVLTAPARALAYAFGDRPGALAQTIFFSVRAMEYWRGVAEAGGIPWTKTLRILAYHAMSDLSGSKVLRAYGVPPDQFGRQIAALSKAGFRFISVAEFAAFIEGRSGLPRRALLLTFDDCYCDLLDLAPALKAQGVEALAFAVSGQLGGTNAWDAQFGGPALPLLDAKGLSALRPYGVEIGAHSRNHAELPGLETPALSLEISGSMDDLEAAGLPRPRFFAYPYGESDERARKLAKEAGLAAAFSITPGLMTEHSDLMAIPRVEVLRSDEGAAFVAKVQFARQLGQLVVIKRGIERLAHRAVHGVRWRLQRALAPSA